MLMKKNEMYQTVLVFKTKDEQERIDQAMLTLFPLAEWNETSSCSTFESQSLARLLVSVYYENGQEVKRCMTHEFDVLSEQIVQLTIYSIARPTLCKQSIKALTPNDPFRLYYFERKQIQDL